MDNKIIDNKFIAGAVAAAVLTVGAVVFFASDADADRTDVWLSSSVNVYQVELVRRSDGGCAVQAWASFSKQDGGVTTGQSNLTDVAGANRTTCLDIIDTRALALFKVDQGL